MSRSTQTAPARSNSGNFGLLVVLVAAAMLAYVALRPRAMDGGGGGLIGVAMPPLEVHGWFNTPTPVTNEDLRGKVVLMDCWFVGCPPCRAAMPRLVEFNSRFRNQEFQLLGLTIDSGPDADEAQAFIKTVPGVDWPIGYGAEIPVQGVLGVTAFPTLILFDKSGRAVWAGHSERGLEAATLAALAR